MRIALAVSNYDTLWVAIRPTGYGRARLASGGRLWSGPLEDLQFLEYSSQMKSKKPLPEEIKKLKDIPEQRDVVGPLVAQLVNAGWSLEQIIFGKSEWRVAKEPF